MNASSPYSKMHCNNCGKYGHINRICKDPVTSLGIICMDVPDIQTFVQHTVGDQQTNVFSANTQANKNISRFSSYLDTIRFLMIQRKHSLGFLEFVRGRFEVSDYVGIIKLFELMTTEEINAIKGSEFTDIWNRVWRNTAYLRVYEEEFNASAVKFDILKNKAAENKVMDLAFYTSNIKPKWSQGEWGFPKGRRSYHEKNIECAVREFEEETGYKKDDYIILDNIMPIKEVFKGTNGVWYKHIYYLAVLKKTAPPLLVDSTNNEIGNIEWMNYKSAVDSIRPYHREKKKILNELFKFAVNSIETSLSAVSDTSTERPPAFPAS
jgi:8-oxo-dGTP pyrophosphatase MutT (NUDIX family)